MTLADINGLILGASTVSGNYVLSIGGALSDSGNIIVNGANGLTAATVGGAVLNNSGNKIDKFNINNSGGGNIQLVNSVPLTITGFNHSGVGTIIFTNTGLLTVASGVTIDTAGNALTISATDLDLPGFLNSRTALTTITQNNGGIFGIGNTAGTMTLSGIELQHITASALTLNTSTNGTMTVDGIVAADTANIDGATTLTATAGTGGTLTFLGHASEFNLLTATSTQIIVNVDLSSPGLLTLTSSLNPWVVGDGATVSANGGITFVGRDIDLNTTGALNAGSSSLRITSNLANGVIDLGQITGTADMNISGDELQRMSAGSLIINVPSNGRLDVYGVTPTQSQNISGLTTFSAQSGNNGYVTFQNAMSTFRSLSVIADDGITINAGAGITTSVGNMSLNGDSGGGAGFRDYIDLQGNLISAGNITLNALRGGIWVNDTVSVMSATGVTVTNALDGANDLTVNSGSGTTSFLALVGSNTPLSSLNVTGASNIDTAAITTVGAQTYQGPLVLSVNTSLISTGGGNISFADMDGAFSLNVNTAGVTKFTGVVGRTTALNNLTTDSLGSTLISGGSLTANVAQTYNDVVELGADTTLVMNNGDVSFASSVNSVSSDPKSLSINLGNGNLSTSNTIGGLQPLASFSLSTIGAGNNITVANNIHVLGDINIIAGNNILLDAGSLLSAAGNITLTGTAGRVQEIGAGIISGALLTAHSQGGTTLLGLNTVSSFNANNVGSGAIAFNNTASLLAVTGINQSSGGNVSLSNVGELTTSGNIVANGGDVSLTTVSPDSLERNLIINAGVTTNGGAFSANAANNASGTGTPLITNAVINTATGVGTFAVGGGVLLNATPILGGNITLQGNGLDLTLGTLNFTQAINFLVNRNIIVNGAVSTTGVASNLSLTADATNTGLGGVLIKSSGALNSSGNLVLSGSSLNGAAGALTTGAVEIQSGAAVQSAGDVSLLSSGSGILELGAGISNAGTMDFNKAVNLNSAIILNSNGGAINFANAVTGNYNLILQNAGNVTLNGNSTFNSLLISNAHNVVNNGSMNLNSFSQQKGTGITSFGAGALVADKATVITNTVNGTVRLNALSLGVNFANLQGSIQGATGTDAIQKIIQLNSIGRGTHFFNGIDMAEGPPVPPNPIIDKIPNILSSYLPPAFGQINPFVPIYTADGSVVTLEINHKKQACVGYGGIIAVCSKAAN